MATTLIGKHVNAPRSAVYRLLVDAEAVQTWQVPTGMSSEVHEFDAREGGRFRISLTYDDPTRTGKTTAQTDTHHGRFVTLIPGEQVVQIVEFETDDPAMGGQMTIAISLADAEDGGTDLTAIHENLPSGLDPEQNELGWRLSLAKLAALAETGRVP
ncbi:SRPBCC domain-containing protein [Nocardia sp. XZ_19_385]|uniref:SRPBCC domain-containing protein n=1 Tax=Nocardia sp. XZ_19_385 TaxID=2769488 RepID=UPI001890B40C|nr:SRPBCC domain-containing protein [Nocardia sp. XZ_19_385]